MTKETKQTKQVTSTTLPAKSPINLASSVSAKATIVVRDKAGKVKQRGYVQ